MYHAALTVTSCHGGLVLDDEQVRRRLMLAAVDNVLLLSLESVGRRDAVHQGFVDGCVTAVKELDRPQPVES